MIDPPKTRAEYDTLVERLARAAWRVHDSRISWENQYAKQTLKEDHRAEARAILVELGITEPLPLPEPVYSVAQCNAGVGIASWFDSTRQGEGRTLKKYRIRIEFLEEIAS